jgi:hypothetical protein
MAEPQADLGSELCLFNKLYSHSFYFTPRLGICKFKLEVYREGATISSGLFHSHIFLFLW